MASLTPTTAVPSTPTSPTVSLNMATSAPSNHAAVVRLPPPHLNDVNLLRRRTCLRPMRAGSPRWKLKVLSRGIVVHNYGHGPAGWTLAPGSGRHVVALLQEHLQSSSSSPLPLDAAVAIVGAGVIGLFTARALLAAGYSNITVYAEEFDDITSRRAGGFLAPAGLTVDPPLQATLELIALTSYDEWKDIATRATADPQPAVHSAVYPYSAYVHRYPLQTDTHGLKRYVDSGRMTVRDVVVDFGNVTRDMQVYEGGVFMDTGRLMVELLADVRQRGVRVVQRHVHDIASLHVDHPFVFNCCGHSAATLVNDTRCTGALGHTIALQHQPANPLYSVSTYSTEVDEDGVRIKRAVYCHPRSGDSGEVGEVGLLGGTFIQAMDEEQWGAKRNEREWRLIVERARQFFYGNSVTDWGGFVHQQ